MHTIKALCPLFSRIGLGSTTSALSTAPALSVWSRFNSTKALEDQAKKDLTNQTRKAYFEQSTKQRKALIPKPSDSAVDPAAFLKAIGRKSDTVTDKFTSWDHLFSVTTKDLKALGIKTRMRKHILGWREWYKRGIAPYAIEIPRRQKKHLKAKEKVKQARLEKMGMI